MKIHPSGSRVVLCGQTDRHDEASSPFSQFCERTQKKKYRRGTRVLVCVRWSVRSSDSQELLACVSVVFDRSWCVRVLRKVLCVTRHRGFTSEMLACENVTRLQATQSYVISYTHPRWFSRKSPTHNNYRGDISRRIAGPDRTVDLGWGVGVGKEIDTRFHCCHFFLRNFQWLKILWISRVPNFIHGERRVGRVRGQNLIYAPYAKLYVLHYSDVYETAFCIVLFTDCTLPPSLNRPTPLLLPHLLSVEKYARGNMYVVHCADCHETFAALRNVDWPLSRWNQVTHHQTVLASAQGVLYFFLRIVKRS